MSFRRIVGLFVVVGLVLAVPTPAAAGILDGFGPAERGIAPDWVVQIVEWVESLFAEVSVQFVAQEGASMGTNG